VGFASEGDNIDIVLDETVFYPESGGQVGDVGIISSEGALIEVYDTKKAGNLILHKCNVRRGTIKKGDQVVASIDRFKRNATERNHTATHLLHKALQLVLGDHVRQAGSLVKP